MPNVFGLVISRCCGKRKVLKGRLSAFHPDSSSLKANTNHSVLSSTDFRKQARNRGSKSLLPLSFIM